MTFIAGLPSIPQTLASSYRRNLSTMNLQEHTRSYDEIPSTACRRVAPTSESSESSASSASSTSDYSYSHSQGSTPSDDTLLSSIGEAEPEPLADAPRLTEDEARAMTDAAGGLDSMLATVNRLRDFASELGLDPDDHMCTSEGFLLLSPEFGKLVAIRPDLSARRNTV